jgi:hypothetical protein
MRFFIDLNKSGDPFYSPEKYNRGKYVARKETVDGKGRRKFRYVYGAPVGGWDETPDGKASFEIGNKKTGSIIHVTSLVADSGAKILGTLRNKDGEVIARTEKEVKHGPGYFDEYRRWNPNRGRLIEKAVEELKLHDRPVRSMREMERSMQDTGMFPDQTQEIKRAALLNKSSAALREMSELLEFGNPTDETRRQLTQRMHEIFRDLSEDEREKSMPYMLMMVDKTYP